MAGLGAHAGTAYIDVKGDFDAFDKDLDTKAGSVKKKMGSAFKVAGAAAAVGIGVGVVAVKGFIKAAQESQVSSVKMQTQLKALGISFKAHASQIDKVIQKTSQLSGLDDEDLQDSFTNIVRVTGNVNEALRLNALAADIARARHISLEAASKAVSKAAGGQAGALGRLGVVVEKGATGQEALAAAQKKFSGQAEAYGKTAAGAQERLQVATENLQEALGKKLLPIVADVANATAKFVTQMQNGTGAGGDFVNVLKQIGAAISLYGGYVKDVIQALIPVFKMMARVAQEQIKGILQYFEGMARVIKGVTEVIKGILHGDFSLAWEGVKDIFAGGIEAAIGALRNMSAPLRLVGGWLVGEIWAGVQAVVEFPAQVGKWIFDQAKAGIELWATSYIAIGKWVINRYIDGIKLMATAIAGAASWLISQVRAAIEFYIDSYINVGKWVVNRIVDGFKTITDALGGVGGWLKNRLQDLITGKDGIGADIVKIGEWIVDKIVGGIKGSIEAVKDAAKWLKDKVVDAVKSFFGISSPSKVMMELGGHLASGLIKGIVGGDVGGFIKRFLGGIGSLAEKGIKGIPIIGKPLGAAIDVGKAVLGGGGGPLEKALGDVGGLAPQVVRAITWAKNHGWQGKVTSGYRSIAEQQYLWDNAAKLGLVRGKTVAAPGKSNHQTGQAIDVTDIAGFAQAMASAPANARLFSRVPNDPVHFSTTGYAQGTLNASRGLAMVGEKGPELVNFRGGEAVYPNGVMPGITVVLEGDLAALAPFIDIRIRERDRTQSHALAAGSVLA